MDVGCRSEAAEAEAVFCDADGPVVIVDSAWDDEEDLDGEDEESNMEYATWRRGHANTVQLLSPAEEKEAYFGLAGYKKAKGMIRSINYVANLLRFTVLLRLAARRTWMYYRRFRHDIRLCV